MSRQYKEFMLSDYFEINYGKHIKQNKKGGVPYITTSAFNNGVGGFVDGEPMYEGGCITVASDGSIGSTFYQEGPFSASNITVVLKPKTGFLTKYIAHYLATKIRNYAEQNFNYGNKYSVNRVRETSLKLPVTSQGEPDWQYMEDFMKEIEYEAQQTIETLDKISTISRGGVVSNYPEPYKYKEFKVGDLFDIRPTKSYKLVNKDLLVDGGINPVIVNTKFNNGVGGYTDKECTEEGGIITFSDTTNWESIFYQAKQFVGYPHVQGMYPNDCIKEYINMYNMQYFVTTFRVSAQSQGFDYHNKFNRKVAKELNIKLPITPQGEPDWQYMEDFMRKIEQDSEEVINKIQNMS